MGRRKRERRRKYLEVCERSRELFDRALKADDEAMKWKRAYVDLQKQTETAYYRGLRDGADGAKEELTRSIGPNVDGNDDARVVYVNGEPTHKFFEVAARQQWYLAGYHDNGGPKLPEQKTVLFETKWMALDAHGTRFMWHVLVPRGFDGYWSDAK